MIIVTGSSKGIGNVIASRLAKSGNEVIGISRSFPENKTLFETYQGDVTKKKSLVGLYNILKEKNITVTGLINSAGIMEPPFVDLLTIEQDEIERVFNTNTIGTILACQTFLPLMNKEKHTPIINISSLSAHAITDFSIYGSSKHAVYGFTRSLAKKLKNTSIRPNCIAPGPVKSEMTKPLPEVALKLMSSPQIISGKFFSSDDIADVVELLFDTRSNSLTGQTFHIGGY